MTECATRPLSLPVITWPDLLLSAPYFSSALVDAVETAEINWLELAPLPRARLYWDCLTGEIANGGVIQYFYNHGNESSAFDQMAEFYGQHPLLAPHMPLVERILALWPDIAPAVRDARASGEWPEALFRRYEAQFDALENEILHLNKDLAAQLEHHLLMHLHDYFRLVPLAGVEPKGVSWIECRGSGYRGHLRFLDGFPVGPNIFERGKQGGCDVIWFTPDRQLKVCERCPAR
ncbi:DMP19 family protein [Affinibrenneria salicis]|nr:DUF4375 domain-containing protein [Affinibrenneria salicis]